MHLKTGLLHFSSDAEKHVCVQHHSYATSNTRYSQLQLG